MRSNEFFYWLQGYFELCGELSHGERPEFLTTKQCECIARHLELVAVSDPEAGRLGKIRAIVEFMIDGSITTEAGSAKIRTEVSAQFVHVIDPAAGPEAQAKLNEIHSGRLQRC